MSGAVPGATMTAVRRRWRATAIGKGRDAPTQGDTQWLVAEALAAWDRLDALTAQLAEAERARVADAAEVAALLVALVDDPWAGFHADPLEELYNCFYCMATTFIGNRLEPTVLPAHDADCPIARARGLLDARRAATVTEEDADGADAGDTGARAER